MSTILYTLIALCAFAANSLLCRMALQSGDIDPLSFTAIRLASGAFMLLGLLLWQIKLRRTKSPTAKPLTDKGNNISALSLFVYALCFSVAYVDLNTGTGALILFSAVQLTMIGHSVFNKEPLSKVQWGALFVAFAGFIYLMLPSATVPSFLPAMLMAISGVAWGIYSIRGKSCRSPLQATSFNFLRSLILVPILVLVAALDWQAVSATGICLAVASGALASGVGYSIWYVALPKLKSSQAGVVQLTVPVLATIAGGLFLDEQLTTRLIIASALILGAVLVFLMAKKRSL
ncbi:DMT family transporter [Pseudoalteromonas sp. Ps84H-4]|uniref:DMT family transporter n=1 Tax=Pseudoalteromonas sp. Ps84H-4 TaxID=2954502 RepID=UPI002096C80E|nr:DMT family transporter [Pseudoalteromonas sp. Ps84H-4]MCO7252041.1 DMT family transporter [Pseudoalteromonas sp. Ps84H-4]